jgi:hypothetical protein
VGFIATLDASGAKVQRKTETDKFFSIILCLLQKVCPLLAPCYDLHTTFQRPCYKIGKNAPLKSKNTCQTVAKLSYWHKMTDG